MTDELEQFEAPNSSGTARRRVRPRVRVLGFRVPAATLAWATAVAAHLVVIAVAVLVVRMSARADWGGGGASGGLVGNPDGAAGAIASGLPGDGGRSDATPPVVRATPVSVHAPDEASDDSVDEGAGQWATRHTASTIRFPSDQGEGFPLGDPNAASSDPGLVVRRGAKPTGGGGAGGAAAAGEPRGGDGSADFSGPGLPGALRGAGLPGPEYPEDARRRREQGTVRVSLEVLEDGSLGKIALVSDGGFPSLGRAALGAAERLRSMRFEPAREGRRPVRSELVVPYVFVLK
jgi:TonB family protein